MRDPTEHERIQAADAPSNPYLPPTCAQITPERTPSAAELNPWHGVAEIGLHSHTPDQSCDDTCSEY